MFSHVCCNAKLYKQGKVYLGWKWWDFSTCLQKPRSQHSEWMRLLQHEHPRATRADQTLKTSSNDVVALLHFDERRLEQTRLWAHPAGRQHDGQRWHTLLESIVLCITYVVCTYHNGKQWWWWSKLPWDFRTVPVDHSCLVPNPFLASSWGVNKSSGLEDAEVILRWTTVEVLHYISHKVKEPSDQLICVEKDKHNMRLNL